MRAITLGAVAIFIGLGFSSCKKGCTDPTALNYDENAKKDDGNCIEAPAYTIPTTYAFVNTSGQSTVDYSGQTERLNQLKELVVRMKTGTTTTLSAQDLKDMFANVGGNGNGLFSFTSSKQLRDKCFALDTALFHTWMNEIAVASASHADVAADGQAGTLTTGTSTYLFDANGREHVQFIEKGLMGAVFMYQALNIYFGDEKMGADNTTAVDPANGDYYTAMEHHFDEAFGYFGVEPSFPAVIPTSFWGKYCNAQHPTLNSNTDMMSQFLLGRAAISGKVLADRDMAITALRTEWEEISAYQAMEYLDAAIANFGTDNAKFLHNLSEAYAFAWNLRYAPEATRRMNPTEHAALMAQFPSNFWSISIADINAIKATINANY